MTELKPCPFCGGDVRIDAHGPTYMRDFIITCDNCNYYFMLDALDATENDLIKAWNRRAEITDGG